MKKFIFLISAICLVQLSFSQAPEVWTSTDIYQGLRKLNVLGSVLYVAAHPDDDNSKLIAYFSKGKLYRTAYLSLTRGDGGQNLIGDEQGIELGLIRTQELLASRKIDGGEQFFSRAYDFGYSKGPGETFTKWDKEKILSDVVWVIRKFQPDIVITRFPTTGEGGHGHHTASAILANEAYAAAADPNRFPEQLKYVKPWQVKRVLWNTFSFGRLNMTSSDQFHFDDGIYNPLLGKSYGEIGAESRSQNKTQGTGSTSIIGQTMEYFKTTQGDPPVKDLMDGVDITWGRVKGGKAIEKMVDGLIASFDFLHPEKSVKGLVALYKAMQQLPDGYWRDQKMKETKELIEQCSGLFITATTNQQYAVQTDSFRINFLLNDRLGVNAILKKVKVDDFDSAFNKTLSANDNLFFAKTIFVPSRKMPTQPYWLEKKMEKGYYNVDDQQKIGQADVDPAYIADITLDIDGTDFSFAKPVKYKFTDPVKGEKYEPLIVVPPVTANPQTELVIKKTIEQVPVEINLHSFKDQKFVDQRTVSQLPSPNEKYVTQSTVEGMTQNEQLVSTVFIDSSYKNGEVNFYINDPREHLKEIHEIKYDHIPWINYFSPAEVKVETIDLKTFGKKIGYIVGAGDKVPEALEQMGYDVTVLGEKELSKNDLDQYDAIITGVRAYNTNNEMLNNYYDKLMKYIYDGGNLIVQYNRNNQAMAKMSPYPFRVSGARITDEDAAVTFLKPDDPVMNFPNKITEDDFKGWIQERSIYHATGFDRSKFETIFSMHDPGEKDDDGSLIIAKYGKGVFVYTGLVFFRELPAGVPGAYRLMANIIALNRKKGF